MRDDYEPILFPTDPAYSGIEIYPIHDLHRGNPYFNEKKWESVKEEILSRPNCFCVFVGDAMENALPGTNGDVFEQVYTPFEQKEWIAQQFTDLSDRIIAIVDGNHERNRVQKFTSLHPLYDCAAIARIEDRYREHFAFIDVGVGTRKRDPNAQTHYVIFAIHRAKETKQTSSIDWTEGVDCLVSGHDHRPFDIPRSKLVYDTKLKKVFQRSFEHIDCGSYLGWGGYSADKGYRPQADKLFKLVLAGEEKRITTVGFYV